MHFLPSFCWLVVALVGCFAVIALIGISEKSPTVADNSLLVLDIAVPILDAPPEFSAIPAVLGFERRTTGNASHPAGSFASD